MIYNCPICNKDYHKFIKIGGENYLHCEKCKYTFFKDRTFVWYYNNRDKFIKICSYYNKTIAYLFDGNEFRNNVNPKIYLSMLSIEDTFENAILNRNCIFEELQILALFS